jgi:hypothetical protein
MMEEGARRRFDLDQAPQPPDLQEVERLDRALRLAMGGPESREIVPPDQHPRRPVHRV